MAVLTDPATYDIHPDDAWRRLKLRVRKPIELAVLKEVAACASAKRGSATSRARAS